jgi:hypothetical protein
LQTRIKPLPADGPQAYSTCRMDDGEVIAHIRDRIRRVRKIAGLAHDPEMIRMLLKLAEEGEADIARLEAAQLGKA